MFRLSGLLKARLRIKDFTQHSSAKKKKKKEVAESP